MSQLNKSSTMKSNYNYKIWFAFTYLDKERKHVTNTIKNIDTKVAFRATIPHRSN
jgi:hypothetical protein